jgi:hypothetical protein
MLIADHTVMDSNSHSNGKQAHNGVPMVCLFSITERQSIEWTQILTPSALASLHFASAVFERPHYLQAPQALAILFQALRTLEPT